MSGGGRLFRNRAAGNPAVGNRAVGVRNGVIAVALVGAAIAAAVAAPLPGQAAAGGESPSTRRAAPARVAVRSVRHTSRSTGARPAATAGLQRAFITVDGVRREYLESVPPALRGPAPLVLAFHGLWSSATEFARQSGLVEATRSAGEVLVLPESSGAAFNDGRLGPRGPRDDAFAVALLDRFEQAGLVDAQRVTVAGFSNGAGMAMQLADAHPDRVAAVVSVDGEMIRASYAPRPTGPVEAVLVHGTADRVQPWLGRRRWGADLPAYVSVLATVDAWVRADGCGRREITSPGPHPAGSARVALSVVAPPGVLAPVTAYRWAPGPSGAGVTFYRITGMGHQWPVSTRSAVHHGDQLAGVGAAAIVVRTALTASREGRRTVVG